MRKLAILSVILMILGMTGAAGATGFCYKPICEPPAVKNIWSDGYDDIDKVLGYRDKYKIKFDLTDALPNPYDPGVDHIWSAKMVYKFKGKDDSTYWAKYIYKNKEGDPSSYGYEHIRTNEKGKAWEPEWLWGDPLKTLRETGMLALTLKNISCGPFKLKSAYLYAKGCEKNPVPEPATMILLGFGLLGLAGFRKRKNIRNK